jgi:hypothetical protein
MNNFNLKKFLVENKITTNSRMLNENTSVVFQMVVPPHMVEYMLELEPTLTSDEIENVFMNYLLSLMEENPLDEYLDETDVTGGTGNSLRDLAADVY